MHSCVLCAGVAAGAQKTSACYGLCQQVNYSDFRTDLGNLVFSGNGICNQDSRNRDYYYRGVFGCDRGGEGMNYILIYIGSVFVSSVSQVLLKSAASRKYESIWREYLNPKVIMAYGMFFASSLITILAYKGVPLSMGPILEASGYIFVAVLSFLFLREKISGRKLAGLLAILAGIVVFSL